MADDPQDQRPENESNVPLERATSMLDQLPQTEQELEAIRNAVMTEEGLLLSVFDILRNVPRRVLMVFKLNDLTRYYSSSQCSTVLMRHLNRSLDHALSTTHSKVR
jgi:aarF domain-containing kinase